MQSTVHCTAKYILRTKSIVHNFLYIDGTSKVTVLIDGFRKYTSVKTYSDFAIYFFYLC